MLLSRRVCAARNQGWGSAELMRRALESYLPMFARGAGAGGVLLWFMAGAV